MTNSRWLMHPLRCGALTLVIPAALYAQSVVGPPPSAAVTFRSLLSIPPAELRRDGKANGLAVAADGSMWITLFQGPPSKTSIRIVDSMGRQGRLLEGFQTVSRVAELGGDVAVTDQANGRVTIYSRQGERVRAYSLPRDSLAVRVVPLRFGHSLQIHTRASGFGRSDRNRPLFDVALFQTRNEQRVDTIATIRHDIAWNGAVRTWYQPRFGAGGFVTWAGDSVVVVVDGYAGAVTVYDVDAHGLVQRRVERVGTSQPVTPDDLRSAEERLQGAARSGSGKPLPIRTESAPSRWSVADRALVSDSGEIWVRRASAQAYPQTWIVIPREGAPFSLVLPDQFWLDAVRGRALYGRIASPGTEGPTIQVYAATVNR